MKLNDSDRLGREASSFEISGLFIDSINTPHGPVVVTENSDGAIVAASWMPARTSARHRELRSTAAIGEYLAGDLSALAGFRLNQKGTAFQQQVWTAIQDIPPGETISYSDLAINIGRPQSVRAVASACARNAIALFVPCHRVIARSGATGGYAWGSITKSWLIDHEASVSLARRSGTQSGGR